MKYAPTHRVRPRRRAARAALISAVVTAVAGSLLSITPSPAEAAAKADLRVTRATVDKTTVVEGAKVTVTHTVANKGRRQAGRTTTRVYLTTDAGASLEERRRSRTNPRSALTDLRLVGKAPVRSIAAGAKRSIGQVRFEVPVGIPSGSYRILVCADDEGKVREAEEGNNCTLAAAPLEVTEAPGTGDLTVQTFADTYQWPEDENSSLQLVKIFCRSSYPVQRYTLPGALTSARSFLEDKAPGGISALRESGQATTPEKAQETAAVALAAGSPGLALAALLEAHRLQPSRGTHLVNAAALATSVGLPNQAIAFLDAAVGRDFLRPPLGIPHEATTAAIRGQALVMTGRLDPAEKLFVKAKQLAPLLSEADAGLANVAACKGKDAVAKRYIRRSRQRSDDPVSPTPPTEDPVRPAPEIDLTRGTTVPLRQLPIAETPTQAADMRPVYYGIADGFQAELQANIDERNRLEQHLRDTDELRTRAEIDRRDSLFSVLYATHRDPEVKAAQRALLADLDKLVLHREEFWGGGTGDVDYTYRNLSADARAACDYPTAPRNCFEIEINRTCRPELVRAHIRWRDLILRAQDHANTYFSVWSKRMSGVAANLIDEEAHQLALTEIDGIERDVYALLVQQAQLWSHNVNLARDHCVEPLPAEVLDPPANVGVDSPGKCEGALKAMNLRATLGPSTVKISCERIEQGFAFPVLPLLDVFVDVKFDFKTGNVSVFAGSKGGGTHTGVEATFKSGIYIKINQQGELVDAGWRVGPAVSVGAGSAEFSAYEGEIDLSFTSSLTPGY